jgi:peroxiredoxin
MSQGFSQNAEAMPAEIFGRRLLPGDPLPHFVQRTQTQRQFPIAGMAGRYLVLCFYGSAAEPAGHGAIEAMRRHRGRFDDQRASFFGVSVDPADEAEARVADALPGIRFLFDFDKTVSRLCGAAAPHEETHPCPQ